MPSRTGDGVAIGTVLEVVLDATEVVLDATEVVLDILPVWDCDTVVLVLAEPTPTQT
jgi:hypothetical protein